MAPTRLSSKHLAGNENVNGILNHGITTRSKQLTSFKSYKDLKGPSKRKADSPLKDVTAKRAAFGDITNAFNKSCGQSLDKDKINVAKKVTIESKVLPSLKSIKQSTTTTNTQINGKTSKAKQLQRVATNAIESVQKHFAKDPPKGITTRAQNGILKNIEKKDRLANGKDSQNSSAKSGISDISEPSLYMTALETTSPIDKEEYKSISEKFDKVVLDDIAERSLDEDSDNPHAVPANVVDFDKENWNDPFQVSNYAMDIFNYLRNREREFPISDYLPHFPGITSWMRALLVDWMVEVQESFELNHETLYLAVKLVDLYMTRAMRNRDRLAKEALQLLGAASLFIAAKFDERVPPLVDDFVYICDSAYTTSQLLHMEIKILKLIDFDLGIPLSYRFLRRYARCAHLAMPVLTLARYVLELSLLDYELVTQSDSKMAAAALYIALRMKNISHWTPTLQYYSGYTLKDILPVVVAQNATLHKKPKPAISTILNKYSHTLFFEVATTPLLEDATLLAS